MLRAFSTEANSFIHSSDKLLTAAAAPRYCKNKKCNQLKLYRLSSAVSALRREDQAGWAAALADINISPSSRSVLQSSPPGAASSQKPTPTRCEDKVRRMDVSTQSIWKRFPSSSLAARVRTGSAPSSVNTPNSAANCHFVPLVSNPPRTGPGGSSVKWFTEYGGRRGPKLKPNKFLYKLR